MELKHSDSLQAEHTQVLQSLQQDNINDTMQLLIAARSSNSPKVRKGVIRIQTLFSLITKSITESLDYTTYLRNPCNWINSLPTISTKRLKC